MSAIDPTRTALLVMDYQPGILGRLDDPAPLLARAAEAIDAMRAAGGTVGFVRVAFTDADYDAMAPTSSMAARITSREAMHADAAHTQIHPDVAPRDGDLVVRKVRVGAFSTTDLHEQLQARGITTLVLAGVSTSGVILSTVRDAADRDYELHLLADATADPDAEVHAFLIERVLPRQATVLDVAALKDRLA